MLLDSQPCCSRGRSLHAIMLTVLLGQTRRPSVRMRADLFFPGLPQDRVGLDANALHGVDYDHRAVAQPHRR